jgi:GR25 family glycosyltransferase involved in LPS biosynthesis
VICCFDALQELSGMYHCLDEAKQQVAGLQDEQAQLFAKSEAETQSADMATAEVVTLKQELAESCEHARAMAAHLASVQEVSCVASHASCDSAIVA